METAPAARNALRFMVLLMCVVSVLVCAGARAAPMILVSGALGCSTRLGWRDCLAIVAAFRALGGGFVEVAEPVAALGADVVAACAELGVYAGRVGESSEDQRERVEVDRKGDADQDECRDAEFSFQHAGG